MVNIRYDTQDIYAKDKNVQLLYCAISKDDGSWHSIPHSHNHSELFYCIGGKGFLHIAGKKIAISKDDLFLINPCVEHTEISDKNMALEYIVIGLSGIRFLSSKGNQPRYFLLKQRSNNHELLPYFYDLLREISLKRESFGDICQNILKILFDKISRHALVDISNELQSNVTSLCAELKYYIDEHFKEDISLDWLAQHTHTSKFYLTRSFHKQYGLPPIEYLRQRRIQEVKHFLKHSDYTLSEICTFSGFSSVSYLSQAFKKIEGISPKQYKQKLKQKAISKI